MAFDPLAFVISGIYDTVLTPASWPQALRLVAEALDAVGAAYIVSNKSTGAVECASFWGPSVE